MMILIIDDQSKIDTACSEAGVHKSFQPTSRAGSTWSKFGARGEHGERGEDGKHGDAQTEMCSGSTTCVCSGSRRTVLQLRCAPVLQLGCAPVLGEPCSSSRITILMRRTSINQMTQ